MNEISFTEAINNVEYMTVKQVARRLGYSQQTILRRIREGKIDAVRSNGDSGHIRISREAFNRFALGERK